MRAIHIREKSILCCFQFSIKRIMLRRMYVSFDLCVKHWIPATTTTTTTTSNNNNNSLQSNHNETAHWLIGWSLDDFWLSDIPNFIKIPSIISDAQYAERRTKESVAIQRTFHRSCLHMQYTCSKPFVPNSTCKLTSVRLGVLTATLCKYLVWILSKFPVMLKFTSRIAVHMLRAVMWDYSEHSFQLYLTECEFCSGKRRAV